MGSDSKVNAIKQNFKQKGGASMQNARKKIQSYPSNNYASPALKYFAQVTLKNALPVFPALMAISCESVGGNAEKIVPFGEAIVLISAAADLHDDVIDQSAVKGSKQTVLGKFDAATSILAGDILLVEGFRQLSEECKKLPEAQSKEIMRLTGDAVFEICSAEVLEVSLRSKLDLKPDELLEVIKLKAVVPELAMKIGAILGEGSSGNVEKLGKYGRAYGVVSIIVEEFADLLDMEEFCSRLKNECLPLPMIHAIQNVKVKSVILPMLKADLLDEDAFNKIVDLVLDTTEVKAFEKNLIEDAKIGLKALPMDLKGKSREELENLLLVPLDYFGD